MRGPIFASRRRNTHAVRSTSSHFRVRISSDRQPVSINRWILVRRGPDKAQETPQFVQLKRASQRHTEEVAEHGGDTEVHVLPEPIEPAIGRIVTEH